MRTAKTLRNGAMWIALGVFIMAAGANAQPNLNFKRVWPNWPTIELYFTVGCNGNPAYNMAKQDFGIFENGRQVQDFTLWCPDPTVRCAISVALVFDASGSMAGTGNAGAKAAGRAFIDQMDGQLDEAAVLWFTDKVTVRQQMTTLKPLLYSAVDALPASGGTAVWDGAYAGILELINNGINQCRAVILMTDGQDNNSSRVPAEVISLANKNRIRVFTIGLGSSINATELEMIAILTGGRYYQTPNAGQLSAIYKEISTIIFQGFQECVITYQRDCADGGLRTVELQLRDFCGGTDVKTKTYRAPLDSASFTPLHMRFGDATVRQLSDVWVPVILTDTLSDETFAPLSFNIMTDTSCGTLLDARIPMGSLLDPSRIVPRVTPIPGGFRVQTLGSQVVKGSGLLFELRFRAPAAQDTTCCTLSALDAQFDEGCHIAQIEDGELCVIPSSGLAVVTCDLDVPKRLSWDASSASFTPDPFPVTMRAFNTGGLSAENVRFRISFDSTLMKLVSPQSEIQQGTPANIDPGQFSYATWMCSAKKAQENRRLYLTVEAAFDNHDTIDCAAQIPFGPVLECDLMVPQIVYDSVRNRYDPMPFSIAVTVRNNGGEQSSGIEGTMLVGGDLSLLPLESRTKPLSPQILDPGQSATVSWSLEHPLTTTPRMYTPQVLITSVESDTSGCAQGVLIPSAGNLFRIELTASGPLEFCEGRTVTLDAGAGFASYRWNTGERDRLLRVTRAGSYFCIVNDSLGRQGVSDTLDVTVRPAPHPTLTVTGDIPMCAGDSVLLEAPPGYISYTWNRGETGRSMTARAAGPYFVTVVDDYGCIGGSDTVLVALFPEPLKPQIRRSSDSLFATPAASWQWYQSGQPLQGETGQALALTDIGSYTVEITDSNGCTATSDPFDVSVLETAELPSIVRSFDVFPNPSGGRVTLSLDLEQRSALAVTLSDVLGRVLWQTHFPPVQALRESLHFPAVAPGRYYLRVDLQAGGSMSRTVVIRN